MKPSPNTLYDKLWKRHTVTEETAETPAAFFIDLHLIHEVTSPQAFDVLRERGLKVRRPDLTFATMDHSTPTEPADGNGSYPYIDEQAEAQVAKLETNCQEFGIRLAALGSKEQGIVHVIGPELGLTQPGMTIVCGDSHTSTHGAFGALAFGIGTSEVGYVFATQCILQRKSKTMAIEVEGDLPKGVGAKDLILAIIAKIGVGGGTGHVIEYRGKAIREMSMEARMTLCNMSIEAGARAGLVAPDEKTFEYLEGRQYTPAGEAWDKAIADWQTLKTDEGATFDRVVNIDASSLKPMITWGTDPGMAVAIDEAIPVDGSEKTAKALDYMGFDEGDAIVGKKIDAIFIGSCTNSRMSDLREAAAIMNGKKVADHVRALIVPGSAQVKEEAEAEGLHQIFKEAGADWREPGCSMCIGMNGDILQPGEIAVSTSNRNFRGRQGKGSRTLLASPATAAAAAIAGCVIDAREMEVSHVAV